MGIDRKVKKSSFQIDETFEWWGHKPKGNCIKCHSRNIRAGTLEDIEYLFGIDHLICMNCKTRYVNSHGWIWIMRKRKSKPHVGIYKNPKDAKEGGFI